MYKTFLGTVLCHLICASLSDAFDPTRLNLNKINHVHKRSPEAEIVIFPEDENSERNWGESKPVDPFDDKSYGDEEKKCLSERKFLFMGKCHKLGSKGPCAENELLLLNKPGDEVEGIIKPVCKVRQCNGTNEIWWPTTNKCEQKTWIKAEHCKDKNKDVILDPYGEGVCSCTGIYGEIANQCYEYYQRGPCNINETVVYNVTTGETECSKDKCLEENNKKPIIKRDVHHIGHYKNTERSNHSERRAKTRMQRAAVRKPQSKITRKTYAPLEGVGKCYKLGSSEPCQAVDKQSKFVVDPIWRVPRCSTTTVLHIVDAPVACRLDHNNKCREQVEIEMEDRLGYLSQLKKKIKAKKS